MIVTGLSVAAAVLAVAAAEVECPKEPGRYYSYDGSCNNMNDPEKGRSGTQFMRTAEGADDSRRSGSGPNVRAISNSMVKNKPHKQDVENGMGLNILATFFGQFIAHDIEDIKMSQTDMLRVNLSETGEDHIFTLGMILFDSVYKDNGDGDLLPTNDLTAYLDLSGVYGNTEEVALDLRAMEGGLLKTSNAILDEEGLTFRYKGRFFPLCHKCMDMSTVPPTPFDPFMMVPGTEPFEQPNPSDPSNPAPPCFVSPCFKPSPHIRCEVNPEWNTTHGRYRNVHHTMKRDWLPFQYQATKAPVNNILTAGEKPDQIFVAGDGRAIENVNLMVLHAMFLRSHNQKARTLAKRFPHLSDEVLYQEARRRNIMEYQHIVYNEYLPALLGDAAPGIRGRYDADVDPQISTLFATAGFRLHSLVPTNIELRYPDGRLQSPANGFDRATPPKDSLTAGNPPRDPVNNELPAGGQTAGIVTPRTALPYAGGEDAIMKSNLMQASAEHDRHVSEAIRQIVPVVRCVFPGQIGREFGPGTILIDVPSSTLARGRAHGIPGYDAVRAIFHPKGSVYKSHTCPAGVQVDSIDCFRVVTGEKKGHSPTAVLLREHYKKVSAIDPWMGIVSEPRARGSAFGLTQTRIIAEQFRRLRDGDRLFYTTALRNRSDKNCKGRTRQSLAKEFRYIKRATMQRLVEDTFGVMAQPNAFFTPSAAPNRPRNVWRRYFHPWSRLRSEYRSGYGYGYGYN